MITNYYSVEDVKAEQYGPLFPAKNYEVAKRMFKQLLREAAPEYWKDYFLHLVLQFDDESGNVRTVVDGCEPLVCGSDFLEVKDK